MSSNGARGVPWSSLPPVCGMLSSSRLTVEYAQPGSYWDAPLLGTPALSVSSGGEVGDVSPLARHLWDSIQAWVLRRAGGGRGTPGVPQGRVRDTAGCELPLGLVEA